MPERIQLRRIKGWKMPPNTVKVDRTTPWGNPFKVGEAGGIWTAHVMNRRHAWQLFLGLSATFDADTIAKIRTELRGKNLACWCALCPEHAAGLPLGIKCEACAPCHAIVLLEIANA